MQTLETDYLVVGAGAVGMAFVDTLLDESDASVIIIDNHHQPGGHWNDAYPFVRLHQPSHFYGVASTPLGSNRIDQSGSNAGFFELASGAEVQAYFERVMRERFLPSKRVQYFPMSQYIDNGQFKNLVSGKTFKVQANKRIVDATYYKTSVPSRHVRPYEVSSDRVCIAPNELPIRAADYQQFCVVGAGKTAMDAAVWLLDQGIDPSLVSWVCPRRSWLINREVTQASAQFFVESIGGFAAQMEAIAQASSVSDLFDRLEGCGYLLRIDTNKRPSMFHFATISIGEVEQLRRLTNLIEQGHVDRIDDEGLHMKTGATIGMPPNTLFIDCTASAVDFKSNRHCPVFEPNKITIQGLRVPNPCLSAALTAYVEANYVGDDERNRLCQTVGLPDDEASWVKTTLGNMLNQAAWSGEPELQKWIGSCRLDGFAEVVRNADKNNPQHMEILTKLGNNVMPAVANLQKFAAIR